MEINDAFSKISLDFQGTSFIEAPYNAEVIREDSTENDRSILYKTSGLFIEKKIEISDNRLRLAYDIEPWKDDIRLETMEMVLWIPWGIILQDYEVEDNRLTLLLGPGVNSTRLTVTSLEGKLQVLEAGPHPEFLQQRILLAFSLDPENGKVMLDFEFEQMVSGEYIPTTRPKMEGSDIQLIISFHAFLEEEFSDKRFTLYRVRQ